ncbi:hypothetical protein M0G43_03720 [Subsaxibacter sp. CAU 1640]|uniref:hypothetical protein n=1 Tax=Subsaxibacter sp. CAU 1640 TaxID=2933271 RepID=UPI002002D153|nr:hypothetical protein [Subsaxibacter sp. CAU 1640]MCK7589671.1 hypothetical protein [Subsaxibacter sp. CAU 1640]
MKNTVKILILILGIQFIHAQEFMTDSTYSVVISEHSTDKESTHSIASVVLTDYPEIVLSSFQVESANRIEHIRVQSLKQPELKDVDDIIRVELSYSEPYFYTISQYVLITNEVESILLPTIVNIGDASSTSETIYVFPNQIFGNVNKIIKLEIVYKESFKVDEVNVLQNYAWNDSDFGSSVSNF